MLLLRSRECLIRKNLVFIKTTLIYTSNSLNYWQKKKNAAENSLNLRGTYNHCLEFKKNNHTIMSTTYVGVETVVDDNRTTKI